MSILTTRRTSAPQAQQAQQAQPQDRATARARRGAGAPAPGAVVLWAVLVGVLVLVVACWWRGTPPSAGASPAGALTGVGERGGRVASAVSYSQLTLPTAEGG